MKETHKHNEHFMLFGTPKPGVRVEGPGADQVHVVANKFKGDAVDTEVKTITALGRHGQSR